MRWREAGKRGLLRQVTGTAETFEDIGRIAEVSGNDSAMNNATALAREVLDRAGLPTGAHIRNFRWEWCPLPDNWRELGKRELLASLPATFATTRNVQLSPTASIDFTEPVSAERLAAEVLQAAYWLSNFRSAGNLEGAIEQAFKLGRKASLLRTVLAGWHLAAKAGDKEFHDSRKANPDAAQRRQALLARDGELKAAGKRPMERCGIIASQTGQRFDTVKKALQRAHKMQPK